MDLIARHIIKTFCIICVCVLFPLNAVHAEHIESRSDILPVGFSGKFLNDVTAADAKVALELWIRQFTKSTSLKTDPKPYIFEDSDALFRALKNNTVSLVGLSAIDYIRMRDKIPLEPALVAVRKGGIDGEQLVMLVRRDQNITNLGQLRGKRLLIHEGYMLDAEYLWLNTLLERKHLPDKDRFFVSIREARKVSQTVLPLFFRQADAAIVSRNAFDTMADLNPQIGKELMVLDMSDKLLYGMFCFSRHVKPEMKALVINNALNMHTIPAGRQIFTLFQIDSVALFKPYMLDTTLALMSSVNRHSAKDMTRRNKD